MNEVEKNAQDFAKKVMSMNRHDRRAFAKQNKLGKIYGSSVPFINHEKRKKKGLE